MKMKNLLIWGLAALGGYALWKRMGTSASSATDPLYAEYLTYAKPIRESQALGAEVYCFTFEEWKARGKPTPSTNAAILQAVAQSLPLRKVEQVLQNGTIVAGMSEVLPPAPMEMAWQYPGLQSAHAPGRIYKV